MQRHVDELKIEFKKEIEKNNSRTFVSFPVPASTTTMTSPGAAGSSALSTSTTTPGGSTAMTMTTPRSAGASVTSTGIVYNEEEYRKLLSDVTQLNILRESNAHLRYENEELLKKYNFLKIDFDKKSSELQPLETKIRNLESDIEVLNQTNQSLTKDISYWRDRLHTLVSRYNDVDPEEHRLIQEEKTELNKKLNLMSTGENLYILVYCLYI